MKARQVGMQDGSSQEVMPQVHINTRSDTCKNPGVILKYLACLTPVGAAKSGFQNLQDT